MTGCFAEFGGRLNSIVRVGRSRIHQLRLQPISFSSRVDVVPAVVAYQMPPAVRTCMDIPVLRSVETLPCYSMSANMQACVLANKLNSCPAIAGAALTMSAVLPTELMVRVSSKVKIKNGINVEARTTTSGIRIQNSTTMRKFVCILNCI